MRKIQYRGDLTWLTGNELQLVPVKTTHHGAEPLFDTLKEAKAEAVRAMENPAVKSVRISRVVTTTVKIWQRTKK